VDGCQCDYIEKFEERFAKKVRKKTEFATFKLYDCTSSSKVAGFLRKIIFLSILSPNLIKQIDKQINKKHSTREQEKKKKRKD